MSGSQWTEVEDDMESAGWRPEAVVALIQWIPKLPKDTIPSVLREALLQRTSSASPVGSDPRALVELAGENDGTFFDLLLSGVVGYCYHWFVTILLIMASIFFLHPILVYGTILPCHEVVIISDI